MKKDVLVDTTETIKKIKELTNAANECSEALIRLNGLIGEWNKNDAFVTIIEDDNQFILESTNDDDDDINNVFDDIKVKHP
ncbi:hypothetical protein [Bacillus pseudomycoides]|uniref:hypothetical protein n=1 Tax=Bacillus pseudomycoides TaxID=64104 RepID=UPI000BF33ED9|nr:hypothetical protein [Bacillus pseudomycoides]PEP73044.1 hypothetical protein CN584_28740 [Bacillus pseudomycoides]